MRKQGETMMFTGGAEPTPSVEVTRFQAHGSMNDGKPTLKITQGVEGYVLLSPDTIKAILAWYERD